MSRVRDIQLQLDGVVETKPRASVPTGAGSNERFKERVADAIADFLVSRHGKRRRNTRSPK